MCPVMMLSSAGPGFVCSYLKTSDDKRDLRSSDASKNSVFIDDNIIQHRVAGYTSYSSTPQYIN